MIDLKLTLRSRVAVLAILLALPTSTLALSCVPPQFDAEAIDGLELVFAGVVENKQSRSLWQKIKSSISNDDEKDISLYTFKIARVWKGELAEGERVEIHAPPGWAMETAYEVGKSYLVFGEAGDEPGTYNSNPGWCGYDLLPSAEVMTVLEQYRE